MNVLRTEILILIEDVVRNYYSKHGENLPHEVNLLREERRQA